MPTLTNQEPDTLDLDHFYQNNSGTYGIAIYEDKPETAKAIPKSFRPTACFNKDFRNSQKVTHFFPAPLSTAIITCLCKKFHTKFIAKDDKIYDFNTNINATTSAAQIKKLTQKLKDTTQTIPQSPILQQKTHTDETPTTPSPLFHTHTCPNCNQVINCKSVNNHHSPQGDSIKYGENYYHSSCITNTSSSISYISGPSDDVIRQRMEQLSRLSNNNTTEDLSSSYTPQYPQQQQLNQSTSKTPAPNQFQPKTPPPQSKPQTTASVSTPSAIDNFFQKPILTPKPQPNPLNNLFPLTAIQETSPTNSSYTNMEIDQPIISQEPPTINKPSTKNNTTKSVDSNTTKSFNNTHSPANHPKSKENNIQSTSTITPQLNPQPNPEPKPKSNPSFDWITNFPITKEMEPNKKLQTKLSHQLFGFLKTHLYDFFPGREIKPTKPNQPIYRASFKHLLRHMAGLQPQFLTDIIFEYNPDISSDATIPFTYLETTLKTVIHQFTTVLFTKLNYKEIFASPVTVPPYKAQNRLQLCLNIARLHLFLSNNYQTINYKKFAEDFDFRPKHPKIESSTDCFDEDKPYFEIKSDSRFNIHLSFNIPKTLFLHNYRTPPLTNSLDTYKEWFNKFFPIYARQFDTAPNEKETYLLLKNKIRRQFVSELRSLLPPNFEFQEPSKPLQRQHEATKATNFHMLTCNNKDCEYLNEKLLHNRDQLYKDILEKSYSFYPKKETEILQEPHLDSSIFFIDAKHEATLKTTIPTKLLEDLAKQAEEAACKLNNITSSPNRRRVYFYKYLALYHQTALENHNIPINSKQEAINRATPSIVDTHFLARIITYFDCIQNKSHTFSQIIKYYNDTAYPEAEKILKEKFNINFQPITNLESLFLDHSFQ